MTRPEFRPPFVPYGGDYNPEQWPASVWDEDMRLMRQANVNIVTLPVFGWVTLQPDEETFAFEWLDDILARLQKSGVSVCLATATASTPAWLDEKYPDVLVVNESGVRQRHGNRHTFCPNSPNFRRLSVGLARRMAERYKDYPGLLLWHVSNEYGTYCYCDQCAAAFRDCLKVRYGTLTELNRRWNTIFWGHTYTAWSQVEPPYSNGERAVQALRLDYHRFQSESLLNCCKAEAAALRQITPHIPITTNMMGTFFPLNYREWAKELDIVSWDNYPGPDSPPAHIAFSHALMRGLKEGQPFLLMEQSPSQQNWQTYNTIKQPGALRLQSFQAVAQGADSVMYFQWRRSIGGIEKLHGAIVEHSGSPERRVFREVAALGADLQRLGTRTIGGRVPARVAVLFDWENWWAIRFSSGPSVDLDYVKVCRSFYSALYRLGIQAEVVAPDADLSRFDVIVAPLLCLLRMDAAERLERHVSEGATLVTTFFSSMVDETDLVHEGGAPGPLSRVLGLVVEETDALPRNKTNVLNFAEPFGTLKPGETYPASLLCDRLICDSSQTLATYADDFYAGEPAVTVNDFGAGRAYYIATFPDDATLTGLLQAICAEKGIASPLAEGAIPPKGIEITERVSPNGETLLYLLNHNPTPAEVALPAGTYADLLTEESFSGAVSIEGRGVRILVVQAPTP